MSLGAQTYDFVVDAEPVLVDPSGPVANVDLSMACDAPGVPTGGLQICFAYNPDEINLFGISDLAANPQTGPAFFAAYWTNGVDDTTPGGPYGPGVGYVAVLWELNPSNFLLFDTLTPILRFNVYSGPLATPGPAVIAFVSGLNLPGNFDTILQVGYTDDTGQSASYNAPDFPGAIPLVEFPTYVRGDANEDGALNLVDCLRILEIGFAGGALPACEAAADANASGTFDTLSDCLYLLGYLFQGGPPPPGGPNCNSNDPLGLTCDVSGCP